jgi:hypothetical protein
VNSESLVGEPSNSALLESETRPSESEPSESELMASASLDSEAFHSHSAADTSRRVTNEVFVQTLERALHYRIVEVSDEEAIDEVTDNNTDDESEDHHG